MQGATDARGTAHSRNILLRQRQKCAGRRPPRIERKHWKCTENKKDQKERNVWGFSTLTVTERSPRGRTFWNTAYSRNTQTTGRGTQGIGLFADDHKDDWRYDCEDGSEYDIDPWSYDTLEEYEEALEDVRLRQLSDGL